MCICILKSRMYTHTLPNPYCQSCNAAAAAAAACVARWLAANCMEDQFWRRSAAGAPHCGGCWCTSRFRRRSNEDPLIRLPHRLQGGSTAAGLLRRLREGSTAAGLPRRLRGGSTAAGLLRRLREGSTAGLRMVATAVPCWLEAAVRKVGRIKGGPSDPVLFATKVTCVVLVVAA